MKGCKVASDGNAVILVAFFIVRANYCSTTSKCEVLVGFAHGFCLVFFFLKFINGDKYLMLFFSAFVGFCHRMPF